VPEPFVLQLRPMRDRATFANPAMFFR
jgi:hypothetical protein